MESSKNRNNRFHNWLFDKIAYFYQWFFKKQVKSYEKILMRHIDQLNLKPNAKILDIGCGTGAFGTAFQNLGYDVVGIDVAPGMVKRALRNNLKCQQADVLQGLNFLSESFDLVIAAFVLHGLKEIYRKKIYDEASRLSKNQILFHDYSTTRKIHISIIEWLERGDYFNFIKQIPSEFNVHFNSVKITPIKSHLALYHCKKAKKEI
ncbi:class I SAM-dependent methyltransferase [Candidatus Lokiarchaeum ossiferum]|uniref:class I SAM-dependent methyltransferase n=1 Tax=Candidatus Lokiarchaeum ossiferum TaxID=2951803 RepID=UPI00352F9064